MIATVRPEIARNPMQFPSSLRHSVTDRPEIARDPMRFPIVTASQPAQNRASCNAYRPLATGNWQLTNPHRHCVTAGIEIAHHPMQFPSSSKISASLANPRRGEVFRPARP
jgi:hypothetical protein